MNFQVGGYIHRELDDLKKDVEDRRLGEMLKKLE
jgi:hypothetical protein